ncbi:type VI secretion system protein TssR domain-containing protein [Capnocytophaga canimorsus]|uniref:type VI secretion system protein TssR domain-containing protein n=1 Tax=Capnocytophaga canimorsus TaxID=28188 RepID=UPI0035711191
MCHSKSPLTDLYGNIHNQSLDNGFPRQKQPWIVFSDRSKNKINPTKQMIFYWWSYYHLFSKENRLYVTLSIRSQ